MVRLLEDPDYRNRTADRAASDMARRFNDKVVGAAITQRLAELSRAKEPGTPNDPVDRRGRMHEPHVA